MSMKQILIPFVTVSALAFALTGCVFDNGTSETRQEQAKKRAAITEQATKTVPVPEISNFQNRKAVAEYMERMDDPDKTFYTYILAFNGDVIGYYVTRTHPISVCQLMTPPENVEEDQWGNYTYSAPTLDGLYADSASGCDHYYAFTAGSDALIEFSNDFFISDQPLDIEADRLAK